MKKIATLCLLIMSAYSLVNAGQRITEDYTILPQLAQKTIERYFGFENVSHIKIGSDTFGKNGFDVVLEGGSSIGFDKKGILRGIELDQSTSIPASLVMKPIREYISDNHPGTHITGYEVKKNGYQVMLDDLTSLRFDSAGVIRR